MDLRSLITIIGILLLLGGSADAQVRWAKYAYFQNWGGLNDNLSTTEIADNEATDIQNIVFDTGGALKKRYGYETIPNATNKVATGSTVCVNGIIFFKKNNGNRYLVAMANNDGKATLMKKNYSATGGPASGAYDNIDTNGFSSSYTNNYQPDMCIASDSVVAVDGTGGKIYIWDGNNKALVLSNDADMPTGSIIEYHKNHLIVSGNSTYPSRVYFSELDHIDQYDATDFIDLETSDGSKVRSMIQAYNALYIFKDKSIWKLSGTNRDDFTLEKMVEGIGTLSNDSVKVVNNLIYFITSQNDVAVYDGAYDVKFISQKIRGTIGNLDFSRAANARGLAFSSYKYVDYDYYASVTFAGSSTNNRVLVYDTAYRAWTKFTGMNANCWCVADDDDFKNALYFGDYSGYIHRYPSTNFYDGNVSTSAIASLYQTKWFKYSEQGLGDKYWRLVKTYCISRDDTMINLECKSDFEASGKTFSLNLASSQAKWDLAKFDIDYWGGDAIIINRNEVEKGTNMFQLKYSNSTVSQGFEIVGFEMFIEPTERI